MKWRLGIVILLVACASAPEPTATPHPLPTAQVVIVSPTPQPSPSATSLPTSTETPTALPSPTLTTVPQPTPDAEALQRRVRLPILMYHYVEPWPTEADELRKGLTVTPEDFAAQMRYLHEQGYVTVSLYDLVYALALGQPLPPQALVLTFDDGYRKLIEYAVPAMEQYGYRGTVFVITELMDKNLEQYLTWAQAEALYAQGWKIEPHTKTHDNLAGRDRDFQLYQILGSAQTIAAHIGTSPRFLAYPAGKYDELSIQLSQETGLWGAVTVDFGRAHTVADLYTLKRVRVNGRGTLLEFITAVDGDKQ